eukprot:CAMPEP_0176190418 /NCGR_PEP_ID=MMETSP0121_2-20121125/3929_1 /TAXON_ID=160619 /ORGANISM="Kryptoperidinium foliaceum, Strain CCMP 1326" /LENGTH=210 /DNA_ID=CAMNT_0017529041 /DNA_START=32 /DNA_END=661 /DNA_ORIENTATION=-
MTIKVEREALITVLSRSPSWPSSPCEATSISGDEGDEFVLVNLPKSSCLVDSGLLRCSSYSDEDSLCTLSTSSESLSTDSSIERRVSFAPSLVSDEWSRPFTPREEVASLFYSTEDTNRFRQEYRLERKVLNELSIDPDTFPVESEELSDLISTAPGGLSPHGRHNISRVVVLHNNKFETFFTPGEVLQRKEPAEVDFDNDSFWSGSLTW